jgi:dephospho-CoA kinase
MVWRERTGEPGAAGGDHRYAGAPIVIVVGLTGSIGMGKSTASAMLRRMRVALFDADRVVHRLLAPGGGAVATVEAAFPGTRADGGGIDRSRLGRLVFGDPQALTRLERILHPMVAEAESRFVARARARGERLVVLDIPLLYESRGAARCDYVIVVSAPPLIQRQRVMRRPGMTEARFAAILRQQMPDAEKRRRADFVVPTGLDRGFSLRRLRAIINGLNREGRRPMRGRTQIGKYRRAA